MPDHAVTSTPEKIVHANGVDLCVQTFGPTDAEPVLLIAGAASSMLYWDEEFCARLAAGPRYVLRYDHRDTGRSVTSPVGAPDYTPGDLLDDAIGVLDAFGIGRAHLVGLSIGGGLAQLAAITYPDRVASLTLIACQPGRAVRARRPARRCPSRCGPSSPRCPSRTGTTGARDRLPGRAGAAVRGAVGRRSTGRDAREHGPGGRPHPRRAVDVQPLHGRRRRRARGTGRPRSPRPRWCCTATRTRCSRTRTASRWPRRTPAPGWSSCRRSATSAPPRLGRGRAGDPAAHRRR